MLSRFTLDLDLVDRGRSTVGGLGPRRVLKTRDLRKLLNNRSNTGIKVSSPTQPYDDLTRRTLQLAQLGSLSESRHISTASTPKCKETYNATVGLHEQGPDSTTRSSELNSGIS
ncbi:hypothetical protein M9H77_03521 [Catharanthus roseus]|uniref:Uncharacterized protein n=1 Tax=Catharanthus roseus TaxID=4058 RepID=A0ACC0CBV8_CATRO|nr:hypothetical protein M9H77_03521 [Catharanthus roseus]